jgi:hypothetical protein
MDNNQYYFGMIIFFLRTFWNDTWHNDLTVNYNPGFLSFTPILHQTTGNLS